MEHLGTGAGLAALGFWLFVGLAVVGGVWDNIRRREAQHETLRRIVESGQHVDTELADKLLSRTGDSKQLDRDLRVGGYVTLFVAPGLVAFGWILSITLEPKLLMIMSGVAALVGFIGLGLLVTANMVRRRYTDESN